MAHEATAAEIRAALRLTRTAPADLAAGRLDVPRARVLADGTIHLRPELARQVVDGVLDAAATLTTGQLRARLRRDCIQADPADADRRYRTANDDRRVWVEPTTDGTANLMGLDLAPDRAAPAMRCITQLAQHLRGPGEERTIDQLRADVYCDLLTGAAVAVPATAEWRRGVDRRPRLHHDNDHRGRWRPL